MVLETQRLIIRDFTTADAPALAAFASREEITRWLPDWVGCEEWIHHWIPMVIGHYKVNNPLQRFLEHAVIEKESGALISHIGCGPFDDLGEAEPGVCYVVHPDYTGRGYATEAMTAYLSQLFTNYGYAYIAATIQPENTASISVAEKLGFRYIRTFDLVGNGYNQAQPFHYYRKYRIEPQIGAAL